MATTRVEGTFSLAYVVFNSINNVTTQDGQVAVFENAAGISRPEAAWWWRSACTTGSGSRCST